MKNELYYTVSQLVQQMAQNCHSESTVAGEESGF